MNQQSSEQPVSPVYPQMPEEEDKVDLRRVGGVLRRNMGRILLLSGLGAVLGALVAFSTEPVYRSTATLLIQPPENKVVAIEEVYGIDEGEEFYNTQYELLRSRALIERLIAEMELETHTEFAPKKEGAGLDWVAQVKGWISQWLPQPDGGTAKASTDGIDKRYEKVVKAVSEQLSVFPVPDSQLVKIGFGSGDPQLAAEMANRLAKLYIQADLEGRQEMAARARGWLSERLKALRENLEDSEKALQDYREKAQLVATDELASSIAQQIEGLNEELVVARQERIEAEAALNEVRALKGRSEVELASLPSVMTDELANDLQGKVATAQSKVESLAESYGPKHPKLVTAKAELTQEKQSLADRVQEVISGMEKEVRAARANEQALEQSLAQSKERMQALNRKSYKLKQLQREVESNRELYEQFLTRFKETKETADLDGANARVADPAVPADHATKPREMLITGVGGTLGLFLGVGLVFLRESLDRTLKGGEDLETRLELADLGALPHLKLKKRRGDTPLHYARENRQSSFAEAVRTIRTGTLLAGLDGPAQIIMVTSSVPGEGKTTVATNLAESMSELHRVLLIDADMRRPAVAGNFQLGEDAKGLSELVAGTVKAEDCIHPVDPGGLFVLPAGKAVPNPQELLSSQRFRNAMESFGQHFDHVIVDSAPTMPVSDPMVMSTYASGVIYVVKADSTSYPVAQEGLKRLRRAGAHLIGGVLNDVPQGKKGGYGAHGYASSYYEDYANGAGRA